MQLTELAIPGAYETEPQIHTDRRGAFLEWFRADKFEEITGHAFPLAQANCSVSAAGTLRGIHFAQLPLSQAKYVTCMRGAILDVIVDIRVGSDTYREWTAVSLDDENHKAVYLSEGLGHAFVALRDDTVVSYLCSAPYAPGREHGINPMDPGLGIPWPDRTSEGQPMELVLSDKDRTAPTLETLEAAGLLPSYAQVQEYVAAKRQ